MQSDTGSSAATGSTTWSIPGSQAESEPPVAPLEPPPGQPPGTPGTPGTRGAPGGPGVTGRTGVVTRPGPQDRIDGSPRRSFASTGPLAATDDLPDPAAVPTVRLRPMTIADILDGAFSIIKVRPARILGIAAVFVVPIHLAIAFAQRNAVSAGLYLDAFTSDDPAVVAEASQSNDSGTQFWVTLMTWFLPALALMFVAAAIAHLVAAWSVGRDVSTGELLRVVGRRWWALVATFVIIHVLETAGCYLGTLFVMAVFVVTAPVIGAEGLGPMKALGRSANLAFRRFWPTLGISLAIGLVSTLLGIALGGLPLLIAFSMDYDLAWPMQAAGNILGAIIATPFVAAATVLLYLDLRVRTEGLDIELAAIDFAHAR